MKRLVSALAVVSLTMMGCGGSLCEDVADSVGTLETKVADCPSFNDATFDEPSEAEIKSCEENLDKCSAKDEETINKFVDCVNDLDKCTPSTEEAFSRSLFACIAPLENVSEGCGETSSQSVVRKAMAYRKAYSKSH